MLTRLLIFLSVFLYKTGYFVRRFKQLKHTMLRKITCDRMRKFIVIKEKSLFIPIRLQSEVSSLTSWGYIVQAVPSTKKKKKTSGRKEENEMKISGKEEKKKKGWKEFVRKERRKRKKGRKRE